MNTQPITRYFGGTSALRNGVGLLQASTFKDLVETFENRKSNCKHVEDKEYYDDMALILQWMDLHYSLDARSGF